LKQSINETEQVEIKEQMETSVNNGKSTVRMETGGTRRNQMRTKGN